MGILKVSFAGIELDNPLIIAACPATESLRGISACAVSGAGAVITKSISDYAPENFNIGYRRTYIDDRGLWAMSAYRRETLTLEDGADLIRMAVDEVDIPIIASVTATSVSIGDWLPTCLAMEKAGARAIQLDLFYLPQPICFPRTITKLIELLANLSSNIEIPIIPKLNIEIPAFLAASAFEDTGIAGISLLDSISTSPPIDPYQGGRPQYRFVDNPDRASIFGSWQLPLTSHYTFVLSRLSNLPLCVGGGLTNGYDVIEMMMLGATTVQFATEILINGYKRIPEILKEIDDFLDDNNLEMINTLCGSAKSYFGSDGEAEFTKACVTVEHNLCSLCNRCLDLAFCNAITLSDQRINIDEANCDGCGLCTFKCDTGALTLRRNDENET